MSVPDQHLDPPEPNNCPRCFADYNAGLSPQEAEGPDYDPEEWDICPRHAKEKADELRFEAKWEDRPDD